MTTPQCTGDEARAVGRIDHYDRFGGLDGCENDVNTLEALLSRNEDNSPNFDCQKRTSSREA